MLAGTWVESVLRGRVEPAGGALAALRRHWPEYLMEGEGLGLFMVSACFFAALFEHPASPLRQAIPDPFLRRIPMGLAMGLTAVGIIYSPWGKQSGAHLNPAVTLTFWRLGKVEAWDALFYILAQFAGGLAGVTLAGAALGALLADPSVNYAATVPGAEGPGVAFVAELAITFGLMLTVLAVSNQPGLARWTGLCAGALVASYITFEAPLSGMSMNPARTLASAVPAHTWTALWIYFAAPPLGMLVAAEAYRRLRGARGVICVKLHHQNEKRCIFRCGYKSEGASAAPSETSPSRLAERSGCGDVEARQPARENSRDCAGKARARMR
jgi:aquaporin Z